MGWISRMGEGKRKDKDEKGDIKCYGMVTDNTVHMVTMIMYGSEIWVVTRDILKVLEGFHHRAKRWITGMTVTRGEGREWEYSTPGGGGNGRRRTSSYLRVHQEAENNYIRKYGLTTHL